MKNRWTIPAVSGLFAALAAVSGLLLTAAPAGAQRIIPPPHPPPRPIPPPWPVPPPRPPPPHWPRIIVPPQRDPGEPMQLKEMEVRARIVGLQVETTTTMTFHNPNRRVLEGELVFPLPDGAAVTGYALDVNGDLVDGVVVKKEKARVAFETETRRNVDPGLVEHVAGNVYRTRIYPLPANGSRQIRLKYVADIASDAKGDVAWHLPLPVGETVGRLALRVEVVQGAVKPEIGGFGNLAFRTFENAWLAETELRDAKPGEDLWVSLPKLPAQVSAVEKTADGEVYFSVSDLPALEPAAAKAPSRIGLAWDASGSRAGDHRKLEFAMLGELFKTWKDVEVSLLVFRDRPEAVRTVRVRNGEVVDLLNALREAPLDGGTDLEALPAAMKAAGAKEWLLFTDGLDTLAEGAPDFAGLNVSAVVGQTAANRELLRQLCAASGGQLLDLQRLEAAAAAAAIARPAPRVTGVRGSGIAEVQGVGAPAIGRVALRGRLTADEAELRIEYAGGHVSPPMKISRKNATDGTLLASVWAAGRVAQLSVRAEANEDELLSLGRRYGLVSSATSLLVLENLDQYLRHDVRPPNSRPELVRQWTERRGATAKEELQKKRGKLDRVVDMWKARVDWWERDYKVPPNFKWREDRERPHPMPAGAVMTGAAVSDAAGGEFVGMNAAAPEERASRRSFGGMAAAAPAAPRPTADTTVAAMKADIAGGPAGATIAVKPWDPDVPYLKALKAAGKADRYKAYLEQRAKFETSPAFFLDCADYFLKEGDDALGVRVLTNLAEMKLEEASLLRVLAWRLEQAGALDRAIAILRRVGKLRPEEPQSLRDLALALAERGKEKRSPANLAEAMSLLEKTVFGEWQRFEEIEVIALEELNALIAWVNREPWDKSPSIPDLDPRLRKNLDVGVRIVMSWDADNTDVDLHVGEPTGEEAFYGHNRTVSGGLVSRDFTQGYGPEEYMVRRPMPGPYRIFTHYYGSGQQTVIGPATITATVFTDFGRPGEKKQVLTLRLDKPREKVEVGTIRVGGDRREPDDIKPPKPRPLDEPMPAVRGERGSFRAIAAGMTAVQVRDLVGEPAEKKPVEGDGKAEVWIYRPGDREYRVKMVDGTVRSVKSVVEVLPGGAELILVQ